MKRTLTVLLVICGLSATAQKYIPFPTTDTKWIQREGRGDTTPAYSVIGFLNDSITIGGNTYHKLYRTHNRVMALTDYIGGMREDAKRVYYYDAATATEQLVYDFNVAVGDTIKDPKTGSNVGVVSYIDSVYISSTWHKRFNFGLLATGALWTNGAWIEGVGNSSLGGLLGSPMVQPTCDCAIETVCGSNNTTWKYNNTKYMALGCEAVLETQTVHDNKVSVLVMPNPLTGAGVLHIDGNTSFGKAIIYDMQGRVIISSTIGSKGDIAINRNKFNPGLYLYSLQDDTGNVIAGKFVVE